MTNDHEDPSARDRLRVDSSGRTTLPKALREHMDARPGDAIEWLFMPDGSAVMRKMRREPPDRTHVKS